MIIAAAIRVCKNDEYFVVMGMRHHNCLEIMYLAGLRRPYTEEQGFMTEKFEFMNRYEAKEYAVSCGQIKETSSARLYSEDLW